MGKHGRMYRFLFAQGYSANSVVAILIELILGSNQIFQINFIMWPICRKRHMAYGVSLAAEVLDGNTVASETKALCCSSQGGQSTTRGCYCHISRLRHF